MVAESLNSKIWHYPLRRGIEIRIINIARVVVDDQKKTKYFIIIDIWLIYRVSNHCSWSDLYSEGLYVCYRGREDGNCEILNIFT